MLVLKLTPATSSRPSAASGCPHNSRSLAFRLRLEQRNACRTTCRLPSVDRLAGVAIPRGPAVKLTQRRQITRDTPSPFTLTIVFKAMDKKSTRKRFRCGYKALQSLKDARLDPDKHYGADVCDARGEIIAERE